MKEKQKSKGITLIALVVTIVVLLILAAVSISMLTGENGIIRQAEVSKDETIKGNEKDQISIAFNGVKMDKLSKGNKEPVTSAELETELNKNGNKSVQVTGNETLTVKFTDTGNKYTVKQKGKIEFAGSEETIITESKLTDEEKDSLTENGISELSKEEIENLENGEDLLDNDNIKAVITDGVVIPTDFTYKEGTKDTGVVIINDKDSSEFVWVPVDEPSTMYGTDENGKKWGKLYSDADGTVAENWTETDGKISITDANNSREPDIISNMDDDIISINARMGTSYTSAEDWLKNELEVEFNNMINSVEKYKGFYVGRYETSLEDATIESEGTGTIVQSKGNVYALTQSVSNDLYAAQRMYSQETESTSVESSKIWGCQYDQMMIWMKDNIRMEIGEVLNRTEITGNLNSADKINNVYDLYGCNMEGTLEVYSNIRGQVGFYGFVARGGSAPWPGQPVSRIYNKASYAMSSPISSRITLYIK